MKVSEYRDLIDAVQSARSSLLGAVGSHEQRCEADALRRRIEELETASCTRKSSRDCIHAANVLYDAKATLAIRQRRFDAADASYSQMAFGGDYR